MAYQLKTNEELEEQQEQPQVQAQIAGSNQTVINNTNQGEEPNGTPTLSGQSVQIGSTPSASGSSSIGNSSTASGFTNVSDYLDQNQNQALDLGSKVGSKVSETVDQAKNTLDSAQNNFNNSVQANTVQYNQDLVNKAAQDAQGVLNNDNDKGAFQKQLNANYTGPNSFETSEYYQPLNQDINKAKTVVDQIDDAGGRKDLIKSVQQSDRANTGVTSLNNLLLQSSPDAINKVQESAKPFQDIYNSLDGIKSEANNNVSNAKTTTEATRNQTRDYFTGDNGYIKNFENDLNSRVEQTRQDAIGTRDAILNNTNNPSALSDDQLVQLGLDRAKFDQIMSKNNLLDQHYGVDKFKDFSPYVSQIDNPEASINAQNVATAEEYAQMQALSDLLGVDNTLLADPSQSGTANNDYVDFNLEQYLSDRDAVIAQQNALDEEAEQRRISSIKALPTGDLWGYKDTVYKSKGAAKKAARANSKRKYFEEGND